MSVYQLPLFPEDDRDLVQGKVYFDGERWVAEVAGGWWIGFGKTAGEAVKNVSERYQAEMDALAG